MDTKQDVISRICKRLRIQNHMVSTGSTEPREFLLDVADQLGLGELVQGLDKPGIARVLVESFGTKWLPSYESRGSTVTKDGLIAIENVIVEVTLREENN